MLHLLLSWLPALLRAYWVLCTASVICVVLPVPIPTSWKNAVWASASRGKLWAHRPRVLGPLNDVSVPQSWFLHFYALGVLVNAAVLLWLTSHVAATTTPGYSTDPQPGLTAHSVLIRYEAVLALAVFEFHLLRRLLETALVMRYPRDARMHVIAYVFGVSYYAVVPLSLLPSYVFSQAPQQAWQGLRLATCAHVIQAAAVHCYSRHGLIHLLGLLVFFNSNLLQWASHVTLARLSRGHAQKEESFYSIPKGGMFEYVSCPHYLAEIFVYVGLALLVRGRANVLLMVCWVTVNLFLAANATHRWYLTKFKNYPKDRRALIPGLY